MSDQLNVIFLNNILLHTRATLALTSILNASADASSDILTGKNTEGISNGEIAV